MAMFFSFAVHCTHDLGQVHDSARMEAEKTLHYFITFRGTTSWTMETLDLHTIYLFNRLVEHWGSV